MEINTEKRMSMKSSTLAYEMISRMKLLCQLEKSSINFYSKLCPFPHERKEGNDSLLFLSASFSIIEALALSLTTQTSK